MNKFMQDAKSSIAVLSSFVVSVYFGGKSGQWAMIIYFGNVPRIYYFSGGFVVVLACTCDRELGSLFWICAPKRESGKWAKPFNLKLRGSKFDEIYGFC